MTYRELIIKIMKMPPEVLDQTITVFNEEDEQFYGITGHDVSVESDVDVLDPGHLFLMVNI